MFSVNKGGDHRIYHNNNSAPATLKLLAFLFVVGLVGGIGWAFFQAVEQVTSAMGRTWTAGNNDNLISGWNTLVIVGGLVVITLLTLAILPYLVTNWQRTLSSPGRGRGGGYSVLPGNQPMLDAETPYGLLDGQTGWPETKMLDVEYSEVPGGQNDF
jgi:hypothetical protein